MYIYDFYLDNVEKTPYYTSGLSGLLTDKTTEVVETNVFVKLENHLLYSFI